MFALMFGMGLSMSRRDFERVWLFPKAVLTGSVVQLVVMPLAGVALAVAFGLPSLLAAGLVVAAACPGGTLSNILVHLGRGDTALSITLTATATLIALLTLPLWVEGFLRLEGGAGGSVEVPVGSTALELATFTLVPLLLGMALRARREEAGRWERLFTHGGVAIVLVAVASQLFSEQGGSLAGASQALPAVLALLGSAVLLGVGVPLALGLTGAQSATIGVEICLKNTVLGIALAELSLGMQAALPSVLYAAFQLPASAAILVAYRVWARRTGTPLARPKESVRGGVE
jgi:BASS family bile acid:Na+ symporter